MKSTCGILLEYIANTTRRIVTCANAAKILGDTIVVNDEDFIHKYNPF